MAKQKIVRIDYRLIHGQAFMCDIYKMAAPGNEVEIVGLAELQAALDKKNDDVMLIFRDIKNAKQALDSGVGLSELNVGAVQTGKDRQFVKSGVALSKEEFDCLQDIQQTIVRKYCE